MFCDKCGKEIKTNSKYCPYCGSEIHYVVENKTPPASTEKKKGGSKSTNRIAALLFFFVAVPGLIFLLTRKVGSSKILFEDERVVAEITRVTDDREIEFTVHNKTKDKQLSLVSLNVAFDGYENSDISSDFGNYVADGDENNYSARIDLYPGETIEAVIPNLKHVPAKKISTVLKYWITNADNQSETVNHYVSKANVVINNNPNQSHEVDFSSCRTVIDENTFAVLDTGTGGVLFHNKTKHPVCIFIAEGFYKDLLGDSMIPFLTVAPPDSVSPLELDFGLGTPGHFENDRLIPDIGEKNSQICIWLV